MIATILAFVTRPPGSWLAGALAALLMLWGIHHHGYVQGAAACETAQARHRAEQKAQGDAARRRAERQAQQDSAKNEKANETIRYVTLRAKALPDGSVVCIPADVADRLRGIE